jgi:hypothetical protein
LNKTDFYFVCQITNFKFIIFWAIFKELLDRELTVSILKMEVQQWNYGAFRVINYVKNLQVPTHFGKNPFLNKWFWMWFSKKFDDIQNCVFSIRLKEDMQIQHWQYLGNGKAIDVSQEFGNGIWKQP